MVLGAHQKAWQHTGHCSRPLLPQGQPPFVLHPPPATPTRLLCSAIHPGRPQLDAGAADADPGLSAANGQEDYRKALNSWLADTSADWPEWNDYPQGFNTDIYLDASPGGAARWGQPSDDDTVSHMQHVVAQTRHLQEQDLSHHGQSIPAAPDSQGAQTAASTDPEERPAGRTRRRAVRQMQNHIDIPSGTQGQDSGSGSGDGEPIRESQWVTGRYVQRLLARLRGGDVSSAQARTQEWLHIVALYAPGLSWADCQVAYSTLHFCIKSHPKHVRLDEHALAGCSVLDTRLKQLLASQARGQANSNTSTGLDRADNSSETSGSRAVQETDVQVQQVAAMVPFITQQYIRDPGLVHVLVELLSNRLESSLNPFSRPASPVASRDAPDLPLTLDEISHLTHIVYTAARKASAGSAWRQGSGHAQDRSYPVSLTRLLHLLLGCQLRCVDQLNTSHVYRLLQRCAEAGLSSAHRTSVNTAHQQPTSPAGPLASEAQVTSRSGAEFHEIKSVKLRIPPHLLQSVVHAIASQIGLIGQQRKESYLRDGHRDHIHRQGPGQQSEQPGVGGGHALNHTGTSELNPDAVSQQHSHLLALALGFAYYSDELAACCPHGSPDNQLLRLTVTWLCRQLSEAKYGVVTMRLKTLSHMLNQPQPQPQPQPPPAAPQQLMEHAAEGTRQPEPAAHGLAPEQCAVVQPGAESDRPAGGLSGVISTLPGQLPASPSEQHSPGSVAGGQARSAAHSTSPINRILDWSRASRELDAEQVEMLTQAFQELTQSAAAPRPARSRGEKQRGRPVTRQLSWCGPHVHSCVHLGLLATRSAAAAVARGHICRWEQEQLGEAVLQLAGALVEHQCALAGQLKLAGLASLCKRLKMLHNELYRTSQRAPDTLPGAVPTGVSHLQSAWSHLAGLLEPGGLLEVQVMQLLDQQLDSILRGMYNGQPLSVWDIIPLIKAIDSLGWCPEPTIMDALLDACLSASPTASPTSVHQPTVAAINSPTSQSIDATQTADAGSTMLQAAGLSVQARLLAAIADVGYLPPDDWLAGWYEASQHHLMTLTQQPSPPQDVLYGSLEAFDLLSRALPILHTHHPPPASWVSSLYSASAQVVESLTAQIVTGRAQPPWWCSQPSVKLVAATIQLGMMFMQDPSRSIQHPMDVHDHAHTDAEVGSASSSYPAELMPGQEQPDQGQGSSAAWLDSMQAAVKQVIPASTPEDRVLLATTITQSGVRPQLCPWDVLLSGLSTSHLLTLSASQITDLVAAMSKARYRPPDRWLIQLFTATTARLSTEFTPHQLLTCYLSLSALGVQREEGWMACWFSVTSDTLDTWGTPDSILALASVVRQGKGEVPDWWLASMHQALMHRQLADLSQLELRHACLLVWAWSELGWNMPNDVWRRLWKKVVKPRLDMLHWKQATSLISSLSKLTPCPAPQTHMQALLDSAYALLPTRVSAASQPESKVPSKRQAAASSQAGQHLDIDTSLLEPYIPGMTLIMLSVVRSKVCPRSGWVDTWLGLIQPYIAQCGEIPLRQIVLALLDGVGAGEASPVLRPTQQLVEQVVQDIMQHHLVTPPKNMPSQQQQLTDAVPEALLMEPTAPAADQPASESTAELHTLSTGPNDGLMLLMKPQPTRPHLPSTPARSAAERAAPKQKHMGHARVRMRYVQVRAIRKQMQGLVFAMRCNLHTSGYHMPGGDPQGQQAH